MAVDEEDLADLAQGGEVAVEVVVLEAGDVGGVGAEVGE